MPLDLEVIESVDCEHYRRDTIVFDTEDTMSVPAYLLVPHDRIDASPGAAVLAIHGHGAGKSMVCDIDGGDAHRRDEITGYNGAYGHELACRGFVVLAPDLRCFGERQDPQWDPSTIRYDCDWNLVCAVMAGATPLGQNVWDLRRSLDVLCAHPLVDPDRVGACGLSYGGTMTTFLAAVDTRVRAAVVSGYLSSWVAAHRVPYNMCGSQVMWGQLGELEHIDIAALIAPRALLVETGIEDFIFPVDSARETVEALRRVYESLGAGKRIEHDIFEGPHAWHGIRAYDFLAEHL